MTVPDVLTRRIVVNPNGCWLWTSSRNQKGYGVVRIDGRTRTAHRVACAAWHQAKRRTQESAS